MRISYGQDRESILSESCGVPIEPGDYKYIKQEKRKVYDFVGFIINDTDTLAVFPKHFYNESELSGLNSTTSNQLEDVSLLFQVLCKYIYSDLKSSKADRYYGSIPEYEADYPFNAFLKFMIITKNTVFIFRKITILSGDKTEKFRGNIWCKKQMLL